MKSLQKLWNISKSRVLLLLVVAVIISGIVTVVPIRGPQVVKTLFTIGFSGSADALVTLDYTIDGVDDNVQVQQALDALPTFGGELVLLKSPTGTWSFSATVSRAINNVTIRGVGVSTYIVHDGVTPLFTTGAQTGWVFESLATDAGGITRGAGCYVENCWVNGLLTNDFVDDIPIDGITAEAVSSNWAFDHSAATTGIHGVGASTIESSAGAQFKVDTHAGSNDTHNISRTATLVVAANNTLALSKAQADYVCDGTADEVQIQAALDACEAVGQGSVVLSEGTFEIASSILIPIYPVRITLSGQGQATMLVPDGALADHFIKSKAITNRTMNCTLRDFGIDGNIGSPNIQAAGGGIYLWGASYLRLHNVAVANCFADGIKLDGNGAWTSADAVIWGCKLNNNGGKGITIQSDQGDTSIAACNIYDNTGTGLDAGGGGAIISNNRIYSNDGDGVGSAGWWNTITNNNISENGVQGISVIAKCVIAGNVFRANLQYGVYLGASANADGTIVEGNWFGSNVVGEVGGTFTNRIVHGNQGFHGEQDTDDTPVDGATTAPISSNWAYDFSTSLGNVTGVLGASAWVVATGAPAIIKTYATTLQTAGYPVWLCDGVDDNVEIQAALDILPHSGEVQGGTVMLSEGTFTTTATINIKAKGNNLVGQGAEATYIVSGSSNVNTITIGDGSTGDNGQQQRIARLKLSAKTGYSAIKMDKTVRTTIEDVVIRWGTYGIYMEDFQWVTLRNIHMRNIRDIGIKAISNSASENSIQGENIVIYMAGGADMSASARGIEITRAAGGYEISNIAFKNLQIDCSGTALGLILFDLPGTNYAVANMQLDSCHFETHSTSGNDTIGFRSNGANSILFNTCQWFGGSKMATGFIAGNGTYTFMYPQMNNFLATTGIGFDPGTSTTSIIIHEPTFTSVADVVDTSAGDALKLTTGAAGL